MAALLVILIGQTWAPRNDLKGVCSEWFGDSLGKVWGCFGDGLRVVRVWFGDCFGIVQG